MNKASKFLLLVLMVFMAIPNLVLAEEYKVGDLVEVINQTGGESQQFYIMATEKEFEIMKSNYCKDPNHNDDEVCTGYDEVDEKYYYFGSKGVVSEDFFWDKDFEMLLLVSKEKYYENFKYDGSYEASNILEINEGEKCFINNSKFTYLCNLDDYDFELFTSWIFNDFFISGLELLYSYDDDLSYQNSGFKGKKELYNIPNYLKHYKGGILDIQNNVGRYVKIADVNDNIMIIEKEGANSNEIASGDVYLTMFISKENIRKVVQNDANAEEPIEENVTKEEITTKKEVKNPSTGDINIVFIMLGLVSFAGLALIANKKFRKIKNN